MSTQRIGRSRTDAGAPRRRSRLSRWIGLLVTGFLMLAAPLYAQDSGDGDGPSRQATTTERLARRSRTILMVGLGTAAVFIVLALSGWLTPRKPDE